MPHMKTECPHCNTIFSISQQQLELADGMVRCGMCNEVFSALVQEDLFAEPVAETSELSDCATPSEDVDAKDSDAGDSELFDVSDQSVVPDELRYQPPQLVTHKPHSLLNGFLWSIGVLLLAAALLIQYAWYDRQHLMQQEFIQPYVSQLCEHIDCSQLALRDPTQLQMTNRNVYTHPTVEDALMVSVTIVNQAAFSQAYPDLKIAFSDVVGTVIAARLFTPEEYLNLGREQLRPLTPDSPVSFALEIQDPGKQALTYEFDFL
jgi:predicted Zn finger-like uncharacterized protein